MKTMLKRGAGVLMPIFSLPSPYGIGTFGRAAYEFIDQLKRGRQTYWQVLPMGPTCYGDSPYQSYSAFAGNPYFIDLDTLKDEKLLTQDEIDACWWCDKQDQVKYDALYYYRFPLLRKAYERSSHKESEEYQAFLEENEEWLDDYALYMAVKGKYEGKGWMDWDEDIRFRRPEALSACREELAEEINYWKFLQFKFFEQWKKLKQYAKEKELQIVGDIPIYVALGCLEPPGAVPARRGKSDAAQGIGCAAGCIFRGWTALGQPALRLGENETNRFRLVAKPDESVREALRCGADRPFHRRGAVLCNPVWRCDCERRRVGERSGQKADRRT